MKSRELIIPLTWADGFAERNIITDIASVSSQSVHFAGQQRYHIVAYRNLRA